MIEYRNIQLKNACFSTVAQPGGRTLCVSVDDLENCGVSINSIKDGLKRHRTGLVYCWPHHKEGNKVYIHFDGLKDIYKELIQAKLCNNTDVHLFVQNREAQAKQNQLKAVFRQLPDMVEVWPEDLAELERSGLFAPFQVQQLARTAGWLRLWRKLDVKTARKMGFTSVTEIQAELFKLCLSEQLDDFVKFPKPVNCIRVLDRKAREFKNEGLKVLIGGYLGNANHGRINPLTHAILMDLAASPLKYSFEDIGLKYNTEIAPEKGLQLLTVSAIKQHLNTPAYKKIWYYLRHGKKAGDDVYQPEALRETPSRPDALWSIDGTTMQLYYRGADGKVRSDLYTYFVADAHTGAIIGKSFGFTENAGMVTAALQDAIETQGYKPNQLQFDNSSANISFSVTALVGNMSRVSFPCTPELGRAKYIEEIIGHFQQRTLRYNKNFKGGNITTRSQNSKANPELLKWLKKNPGELPTEDEVIEQFTAAVEEWNSRGESRDKYGCWTGKSKIEKYQAPDAARTKLNYFDKLSLFMCELEGIYKYKKKGIELTMNGTKHYYIVPDPDNSANDFMFSNANMYAGFKIRVNVSNPEFIILYDKNGKKVDTAYEKERFKACVADMKTGDGAKIRQFIEKQQENGYNYAMQELERQRFILEQNGLRATGTGEFFGSQYSDARGEYFGWQDRPKFIQNVIENKIEDEANGMDAMNEADIERQAILSL